MDIHVFGRVFVSLCIPSMFMPFVLFHWGYLVASVYIFQFEIKWIEIRANEHAQAQAQAHSVSEYIFQFICTSVERDGVRCIAHALQKHHSCSTIILYTLCTAHGEWYKKAHIFPASGIHITGKASKSKLHKIRNHLVRLIMGRKN